MTVMNDVYEQAAAIPMGEGELVLFQWTPPPLPYYGPYDDLTVQRMVRDFYVTYIRSDVRVPVPSLVALRDIAHEHGLSLATVACSQEYVFAMIIRRFLGTLDTVVQPLWRYDWMEEIYSVRLDDHKPRVEGGVLRFLLMRFSVKQPREPLREIALNLQTLEYTERVVALAKPLHQ